ncbi:MAG: hypothetical protein KKH94_02680 [Candidatus Omnitrophica bacterium]|nr:hypothetical protein [Candidatus Omnitrophota bacterium]
MKLTLKIMNSKSEQILNSLGMFDKSEDIQILIQIINEMEALYNLQEPDSKEWPEVRKAEADLWFRVLQSVRKKINRDYDFDNPPQINIAPPGPYPSGTAPESIKEPEIRKEYEKAIAKNEAITKRYNFQYKLRDIEKKLSRKMEDLLVRAYSKAPQSSAELIKYFEKYNVEQETRTRILKRINE